MGHADAYDFMLGLAQSENLVVTEEMITRLHGLFYNRIDSANAGYYRDHQVIITGTEYMPPAPEKIPALMADLTMELKERTGKLHPALLAAYAHRRLADIHPFADGNGRTARLLMNMLLINKGYCVVSIPPVLRIDYISALRTA